MKTTALILVLFLISMLSYSQDYFTKELEWEFYDSISIKKFQDTSQIKMHDPNSGRFVSISTKYFQIHNLEIYIVLTDFCSGINCPFISIFKFINNEWQMIASSNARLGGLLLIEVDNQQEKIIFKTKNAQIGELPFEIFNIKIDSE